MLSANDPIVKLSSKNLSTLGSRVRVPTFDRKVLRPGIVHIGVGGFNRAHQAVYLDDLLHRADTERWGECGLGLRPDDDQVRQVLRSQDFLYTAVERSAERVEARVVGSLCDFLLASEDPEAAIEKMASPECRIVGLTITEAGYLFDGVTGIFEDRHPDVLHDLANPRKPRSFLGYVTEALDRRRTRGLPPFTVMSCDNLPGNGRSTRYVVTSFAELKLPALRSWIEENVMFPNSMVDRITPATTDADRKLVRQQFGIEDGWPVISESYRQWVLEDFFCNGRPSWELAGVQFTADVAPFEEMKVRLLNGSHFAMAYLGSLLGFGHVHDVLANDLLRRYIQAFMDEVTPVVPAPPGISIAEYKSILLHRFSNPALCDQLTRICSQGSSKISKFLLPSLEDLLRLQRTTPLLALALASWLQYMKGTDEQGRTLLIQDAALAETRRLLASGDPLGSAMLRFILGPELSLQADFTKQLRTAFHRLDQQGAASTLEWYLNSSQNGAGISSCLG